MRLVWKVEPPPMSVRRSEVRALTLRPIGLSRCHQSEGDRAAPGFTFSLTTALSRTAPRRSYRGGGKPPDLPETKPISSSGFSYLFLAEGGGRRGASDDRDEGGQGHQIGQHVEDEGAG